MGCDPTIDTDFWCKRTLKVYFNLSVELLTKHVILGAACLPLTAAQNLCLTLFYFTSQDVMHKNVTSCGILTS